MASLLGNQIVISGRLITIGELDPNAVTLPAAITLSVDNALMQAINLPNVITSQPTTSGTPVNDYIFRLPILYQVEGYISKNTVSSSFYFNPNLYTGIFSGINYLSASFSQFQIAAQNLYIFDVNTGFAKFSSMGISNIELVQDKDAINVLKIKMNMQEAIKAPNQPQTAQNNSRIPANRGKLNG